jgi:riboflavin synthase
MFTGIIQAIGTIDAVESRGADLRIGIHTGKLDMSDVAAGDSIAVNGVCLTVVEQGASHFHADVSAETLSLTTLKGAARGTRVNLEKALTPTTRLGGHLVSGHVDGIGEVTGRHDEGRSVRFRIKPPAELARYIARKGSVCVDGVSLTVNEIDGSEFGLNIVPHTLKETTFGDFAPGSRVNLEVDIIARYLERLLLGENTGSRETLSREFLAEHGFLKPD